MRTAGRRAFVADRWMKAASAFRFRARRRRREPASTAGPGCFSEERPPVQGGGMTAARRARPGWRPGRRCRQDHYRQPGVLGALSSTPSSAAPSQNQAARGGSATCARIYVYQERPAVGTVRLTLGRAPGCVDAARPASADEVGQDDKPATVILALYHGRARRKVVFGEAAASTALHPVSRRR